MTQLTFNKTGNNREIYPFSEFAQSVINRILSVPIAQRSTTALLTKRRLISTGLFQPVSEDVVSEEADMSRAMSYIEQRRRQAQQALICEANSGDAPNEEHRRQRVRVRSPEVHMPSGAVAIASSSRGTRHSLAEFEGPYAHGESEAGLRSYIDEITTNFRETLINDREEAITMSLTRLFGLSIQDSFNAGARANLTALRVLNDCERLKVELGDRDNSLVEGARLLQEARDRNQSLERDLACEKEVSAEISVKFNDLSFVNDAR